MVRASLLFWRVYSLLIHIMSLSKSTSRISQGIAYNWSRPALNITWEVVFPVQQVTVWLYSMQVG